MFFGKTAFDDNDTSADRFRPRRSELNPLFQNGNFGIGKLFLGRHLKVGLFVTNRLDERRLLRLTGNQRRPGVAAGFEVTDVIRAKATLLLFLSVALKATV